jgi:cystathionine gamma-lyase
MQNSIGAVPAPFDCFMSLRGIKTLAIRMKQHESNATAVARFLEGHEKVAQVIYPGLASHPQHRLACTQMRGFGGMVTFHIIGGMQQSRQFLESLRLFALAESLGAVESLAEHPAIMTHASVPAHVRARLGVEDSLVRLSVGIEDIGDIIADLRQALKAVQAPEAGAGAGAGARRGAGASAAESEGGRAASARAKL